MRVLITAVDSFIGSWLAESFVSEGAHVVGTVRRDPGERGGVTRRLVDIGHAAAVDEAVRASKPDVVVHLAAQSSVKLSVNDPSETLSVNVLGSLHVFDAVRAHAPHARVVSVGSSAEYGDTAKAVERLCESDRLEPVTPYGVSKVAQGQLARIYAHVHGVHAVHVRPFSVIGPRKRGDALGDFCTNVAAIERGGASELAVGNTASIRDFVDVRDCVTALQRIAGHGTNGEAYNLCSGTGASLMAIIEVLRGISRVPFTVVTDPARLRPVDDVRLVGDPSKLLALGYVPRFTLADTVAATLDYWRATSSSS